MPTTITILYHLAMLYGVIDMPGTPPRLATELIRTHSAPGPHGEHSEALHLTSSFRFADAAGAADAFARQGEDYVYSRFSNPTVDVLNRRVAALEGAEFALSTATGMGAILALCMGFLQAGSRVVSSAHVFGATVQLLSNFIRKFGVEVDFVTRSDTDTWREALSRPADLVLVETPSNPLLEILDLAALAELSHKAGAVFAVDNCYCPWAQRPIEWGADIVVHSGTKYLDGQGRVMSGTLAGPKAVLMERIYPFLRSGGPSPSPFNAWVVAAGLETLPLRYPAHCRTALQLAQFLQGQPGIERVLYTGLSEHPQHKLAMRQQNGHGGGIVSLFIEGGRDAAWRFIDALRVFSITANFGDAKSTVTHPASTTHLRVPEEMRRTLGITDGLVRLSAGLEDADDLIEDIERGLAALRGR